ncbi:OprD family outer membrane porin [Algivirga pacifica]|uniref:Capsule assembly protein Wzi n=1 Tax=Algivirga pacifica TaxID=1162670 RepID=A0ABP9D1F1_9BACT
MKRLGKVLRGLTILMMLPWFVEAQHHAMPEGHAKKSEEVHSIREFFSEGHFHGHIRLNSMATINSGALTDYYANGLGGVLEYQTANFKGFELGLSGFYAFNLGSSDFSELDPIAERPAWYEWQLFDLHDPENKYDLDRLEQLYLRYRFADRSYVQIGRMGIHTPLMNTQDTRMKPYVVQGAWSQWEAVKSLTLHAGFFTHASPRSTLEWYPMGEVLGMYEHALWGHGHEVPAVQDTEGVAILGINYQGKKPWSIDVWNYTIENISNTFFGQWLYKRKVSQWHAVMGLQYIYQHQIGTGGHEEAELAFMEEGQQINILSGKLGIEEKAWEVSMNYTWASDQGRYTFPREWGREHLFTSILRNRMDGLGNFQVLVLKSAWKPSDHLTFKLEGGRFWLPSHEDKAMNHYGDLSHNQLNVETDYDFSKFFEGLHLQLLYVWKGNTEELYGEIEPLFYNADLHHFSLIANIEF